MKVRFHSSDFTNKPINHVKPLPFIHKQSQIMSSRLSNSPHQNNHHHSKKTKKHPPKHEGKSHNINKNTISSMASIEQSLKSIEFDEKYEKLLGYRKSAMKEYSELAELYETNQWKLIEIIKKQLVSRKYLYPIELIQFLKNPSPSLLKSKKKNVFKIELIKLIDYLTEFNANKKIKKIQIIRESMEKREDMIRKSIGFKQYYDVYQFIRSPYHSNQGLSIYDQLRFISEADHSLMPKQNIEILEKVYTNIKQAEEGIYDRIKAEAIQRRSRNRKMMGLETVDT